ncbi:MAG TPA: TolC family protein, partial [Opitutales bacterium]|nr:TolC family protein [Opitutales bacterium]
KFQYKAQKLANCPTVGASAYAGINPMRHEDQIDSTYVAAGITLSIPIFTGGELTATEERARYKMKAFEQDLIEKENQIVRDLSIAWSHVQNAYRNIEVSEQLYRNSVKLLELTQTSYKLGDSSMVDLALAQLGKTQTEIGFAIASYDYLIDLALLEFYLGTPQMGSVQTRTANYQ